MKSESELKFTIFLTKLTTKLSYHGGFTHSAHFEHKQFIIDYIETELGAIYEFEAEPKAVVQLESELGADGDFAFNQHQQIKSGRPPSSSINPNPNSI